MKSIAVQINWQNNFGKLNEMNPAFSLKIKQE